MKFAMLFALVAVAYAFPQQDIAIVRSDLDNDGLGNFNWGYETSDGTQAEQAGQLQAGTLEDGSQGQFQTVKGSYSYTSPEGKKIVVTYESDDKGYRSKTSYA